MRAKTTGWCGSVGGWICCFGWERIACLGNWVAWVCGANWGLDVGMTRNGMEYVELCGVT